MNSLLRISNPDIDQEIDREQREFIIAFFLCCKRIDRAFHHDARELVLNFLLPSEFFTQDFLVYNIQLFRNISLRRANLQMGDFSDDDLDGFDLRDADFSGSNLMRANLEYADLRGANLEYASLDYASFDYADLRGANLEGASLEGARFECSKLEDANLSGTDLEGVNLRMLYACCWF